MGGGGWGEGERVPLLQLLLLLLHSTTFCLQKEAAGTQVW